MMDREQMNGRPPALPTHPKPLTFIQANLRHCKTATASFFQLLLDLDIDVALVQEPYASFQLPVSDSLPTITGLPGDFDQFHRLGPDHHYGAAVFARRSLRAALIGSCSTNHAACVSLMHGGHRISAASIYLRPSLASVADGLRPIFDGCAPLNLSIMGVDANARNPLWNSRLTDPKGRELEELLTDSGLGVANLPLSQLRFNPPATSFIDVTLQGHATEVFDWRYLDLPSLSDHPLIYFRCGLASSVGNRYGASRGSGANRITLPPASSLNRELFASLVDRHCSGRPAVVADGQAIDQEVQLLTTAIQSSARRSGTNRRAPSRSRGRMPWWTKELWGLRNSMRTAYNAARNDLRDHRASLPVQRYRTLKAKYQRELRKAEAASWTIFANGLNGDLNATLKAVLGEERPRVDFPTRILDGTNLITDATEFLAPFGRHFFPSDPPDLAAHLETITRAAEACRPMEEFFPPLSAEEVADAIASLKPDSAPGPDGISSALISMCPANLNGRLLAIYNACLVSGHFPSQWKHARVSVVPKPKKSDYSVPGSFRPISVLNSASKVFEKAILARMRWIAEGDQWFSSHQHGFLRGRSTETAAHSLVSFVERGLNKKETSAAAFLDIKSAFDSAWRPAIIATLASRGCPAYLLRIVDSFLTGRSATLTDGSHSFTIKISTGCPQGSVLSAFLWITLIDPALRLELSFEFRLIAYADDVTAVVSHRDPAVATRWLQLICEAFIKWTETVKLAISFIKTVFMLISRRHQSSLSHISLELFGQRFSSAESVSFLGLHLDRRLSWRAHINNKCMAAKRLGHAVRRYIGATWGLSGPRIRTIYSAVVEPTILYCCSVWCSAVNDARTRKLLRAAQRIFSIAITRSFGSVATEALLVLSGLLPIDLRVKELAASRFLSLGPDADFSSRTRSSVHRIVTDNIGETEASPRQFFSADHPPWAQRISMPILLPSEGPVPLLAASPGKLRIYTDGSVIGTRAGYGVVICDSSRVLATCRGRLPDGCSIFQAEGAAIRAALIHLADCRMVNAVDILVDSRAALIGCTSAARISPLYQDIRMLLLNHPEAVQLFWVAAHKGHEGNELADVLAKDGALRLPTPTDYLPATIADARNTVRSCLSRLWEQEWRACTKGKATKLFLPSTQLPSALFSSSITRELAQVLTGHCYLAGHLHRLRLTTTTSCQCGEEYESVQHVLLSCPASDTHRSILRETLAKAAITWPPSLERLCLSPIGVAGLVRFARESGRFHCLPRLVRDSAESLLLARRGSRI